MQIIASWQNDKINLVMINFFLIVGRVTKLELRSLTKKGNWKPTRINITIDDKDGPTKSIKKFVQVISWKPNLEEGLKYLQKNSIPVIAHCYISSAFYPHETKGKNYFEISLIKLGYFKNFDDLTAVKSLKEEIKNKHQEFKQKIKGLENIDWWGSDNWSSSNKIPRLSETWESAEPPDVPDETPEDSDPKSEDSTPKTDNQDQKA